MGAFLLAAFGSRGGLIGRGAGGGKDGSRGVSLALTTSINNFLAADSTSPVTSTEIELYHILHVNMKIHISVAADALILQIPN
jgi:hypothetical protein